MNHQRDSEPGRGVEQLLAAWRGTGAIESLGGIDCFVVDKAGDPALAPVLWLQGFPSSALDWRGVIETIHSPRPARWPSANGRRCGS